VWHDGELVDERKQMTEEDTRVDDTQYPSNPLATAAENELVPPSGCGEALARDLAGVLNRYSAENMSNTPDFLLAEYLIGCLANFNVAIQGREAWYNRAFRPGVLSAASSRPEAVSPKRAGARICGRSQQPVVEACDSDGLCCAEAVSSPPQKAAEWLPIYQNNLPIGTVLLTNNLHARNAHGQMSHVWIGTPIETDDPLSFTGVMTFSDGDRRVHNISHWMALPAPPSREPEE
jgi:hypothetical protein